MYTHINPIITRSYLFYTVGWLQLPLQEQLLEHLAFFLRQPQALPQFPSAHLQAVLFLGLRPVQSFCACCNVTLDHSSRPAIPDDYVWNEQQSSAHYLPASMELLHPMLMQRVRWHLLTEWMHSLEE